MKNAQDSSVTNFCPICGQHLTSSDLENHFSTELTRLAKFHSYSQRHELRRSFSSEMHALQNSLQGRNNRWETFQRIQTNRQSRLRAKLRKRKFDETDFSQIPSTCQACPGKIGN
jgi:E3 ubiquitin-protein ligase RNF220